MTNGNSLYLRPSFKTLSVDSRGFRRLAWLALIVCIRNKYLEAHMTTGHDIAMALRAAYMTFHRQADAHLSRKGVTADQFVLLAALADGDAVSQQNLVRRLSSDPNTVRAMLVLLEGRGFVVRQRDPTDRRLRSVALTAKGRRAFEKLRVASEPLRARLVATFRRDEVAALLAFLDRIATVMGQPAASRSGARGASAASARTAGGTRRQ
jgi:DNA-binding MarR family transcriptional regulator